MFFHSTTRHARNDLSSPKFLSRPRGFGLAGGSLVVALILLLCGVLFAAKPQAAGQVSSGKPATPVVFATQIRPILASRCYPCHGPDVQQHGLRLDSLQAILTGSMNGKVVIPGDSQNSHIVRRLQGLEEPQMPYGGPALSTEQIDLIRNWIDQGAQGPDSAEPIVAAAAGPTNVQASAQSGSAKPVDFNREIRPILSDFCFTCHGPDEKSRQTTLRLDSKENVFAERNGYRIVVPGDSAASRLYQKISSKDQALRMPPVWSGRSLTPKQIESVRLWIDQGAKWQSHWAFDPPKRPELPKIQDKTWPKNAIDNFTLARLEAAGLKPSPAADKATLLRRVSLDLTGLPPTPAEVDAFVADRSPGAYEKRVDELLKSPHYGERMAIQWLDLARYSDTHGFHIDSLREMWPWRDWVINAFNRNMPFDQFTIEQLAGDLLPNATVEQKIAGGFNRNNMVNFEGGAIPEEYHVEYVVDRVSTTATTWLGLTMGCARCHDHKYDPIKQKEFYRFFAFFNTVPERGLDGYEGNAVPMLSLPTPEQQQRMDDLNKQIAAVLTAMPEKEVVAQRNEWQKTRLATLPEPPRDGLSAQFAFDGNLSDGVSHQDGKLVRGEIVYDDGPTGKAAELREAEVSFGQAGDFDVHQPFAMGAWVNLYEQRGQIFQKRDASEHWAGYELGLDDVAFTGKHQRNLRLIVRLAASWPESAIEVRTKDRLLMDDAHHLLINYDGSGKAAGINIFVDGKPWEKEIVKDALRGSFRASAPLEIGNKNSGGVFKGQISDLRIYTRPLTQTEVENLAVHFPARVLLTKLAGAPATEIAKLQADKPPKEADVGELEKAETKEEKQKRVEREQQARLSEYFLKYDAPEKYRQLYTQLGDLRKEREKLEKSITTTMVMAEMSKPRDTFVLGRGQYENRGEKVTPGVPAFLPPMSQDLPTNRLGLAKWILDPSNPLTARVAVNQYWQQYFGTGLVKTAEDFGSQGEPPSHPELLDWLATEFVRSGWDIKAMQRLIVTSATYRQSSRASRELIERDPENRLLARGPRFRLPAEIVRDNALAISGLLNDKVGGPSVYPYQPPGLWEEMAFGQGFSGQTYTQSSGADLYRRGIYTVWKRTVPPSSLTIFDAPDREKCTARRGVTNTPLQALALLNDPTYVEAARALAQRALRAGGKSDRERVDFAFKLATARTPDQQERAVLLGSLQDFRSTYRQDQAHASKLLSIGEMKSDPKLDSREVAAWTMLSSMILNLDETVTAE